MNQAQEQFKTELMETLASTPNVPKEVLTAFQKLLNDQPTDFFGKKSNVAHMTASSLVVNDDLTEVLLTDHVKLKMWLQLGGHWCDFEDFPSKTPLQAAMKEVEEEGYGDKPVPQNVLLNGRPLDLDVHSVGTHFHYDICFLTQVSKSIPVVVSEESADVKWTSIRYILDNEKQYDSRLVRMCQKVEDLKLINELTVTKQKIKP
jgi:8-oxo-dGTP pyrophosphatase MutT (NUDIX family)